MARVYEVNPTTQQVYQRQALDPPRAEWIEGQTVPANDPLNNGASGILVRPPDFDLVLATESTDTPSAYQRWDFPRYSVALQGSVGDPAARVIETARLIDFDLDETFAAKTLELNSYTALVSSSAFQHDVSSLEFWAEGDLPSRSARASYNGYLSTRIADQLTNAIDVGIAQGGGNTNAEVAAFWAELKKSVLSGNGQLYWDRDIKVVLYDRVTLKQVRDNANQSQWSGLAESQGTFDWQWRSANNRVWDDMVAAYDDDDILQLQLIDVADPTYNWPDFYSGPWAPGRVTIAELLAR